MFFCRFAKNWSCMQKFNCPICHKEFNVDDAIIEKVVVKSEKVSSTVRGRHAVHTYRDHYYLARLCKKCIKKREIIKWIINLLVLIPVLIWGIQGLAKGDSKEAFINFFMIPLSMFLAWLFVCLPIYALICRIFFHPNREYAGQHNAIEY